MTSYITKYPTRKTLKTILLAPINKLRHKQTIDHIKDILNRMDEPKVIDCDKGWYPLLVQINKSLRELDPHYKVIQVKEKYGGLRYYFDTNSGKAKRMRNIVIFYEDQSYSICEMTGKKGQLMRKNGVYKTLHRSFYDEGWNFV